MTYIRFRFRLGYIQRYTPFLEGFRMNVTKAHACNTFANSQQNYINTVYITIHPFLTNADFWEDKKIDMFET